jgi:hypothetical protein
MFNFLTDNIILVLAVVGTLLALAASLYEKITKQKKLRILVTFISAGAIITVGTLILNDLHEKNRSQIAEELENKKKEMIKSISANVSKNLSLSQQSLTLLEQIEAKFAEVPLGDVAVKLTSPDLDGLHVFDKAHPSQIPSFVSWLNDKILHGQTPAIGFTVNANRSYSIGLTLGYLLANQTNLDLIMEKLNEPEGWNKFPDNDTLQAIDEIQSDLKYVLFYDGSKSRLLGFADASLFARELLVLQKQGRSSKIEELLKTPGKASASSMKPYFTSFNPRVLKGTTSYDVTQEMINEKFNDGVLLHKGTPWFVSLANMIKLAT